MAANRKTGLGLNAVFGQTPTEEPSAPEQSAPVSQQKATALEGVTSSKPAQRKQIRATVLLFEEDYERLDSICRLVRKTSGRGVSQSEVVRLALRKFAKELGVT